LDLGLVLSHVTKTMHYNPRVSSLSLEQFCQSGSPNGKITPAVLLPLMKK